jgi:hypothetical protein
MFITRVWAGCSYKLVWKRQINSRYETIQHHKQGYDNDRRIYEMLTLNEINQVQNLFSLKEVSDASPRCLLKLQQSRR